MNMLQLAIAKISAIEAILNNNFDNSEIITVITDLLHDTVALIEIGEREAELSEKQQDLKAMPADWTPPNTYSPAIPVTPHTMPAPEIPRYSHIGDYPNPTRITC